MLSLSQQASRYPEKQLSDHAGAAWLKLLLQHVPNRGDHLVRYYGWYSNRSRGAASAIYVLLVNSNDENSSIITASC